MTALRRTSTLAQLGKTLFYSIWLMNYEVTLFICESAVEKSENLLCKKPMKQLHISQRSGNFGGRKRRAVGDASEDTEEVA